jgi:uncharacterized cupin superfamily protein
MIEKGCETMPRINVTALPFVARSGYPPPHDQLVTGRSRKRLGDEAGLSQFGVNLTKLAPGAFSSLRHWHENQDEFVFLIEGELTLIEDEGETVLRPGEAAGFKAGVANGHHLVNRSNSDAVYLEIGTRTLPERAHYSDVDLAVVADETGFHYSRKDGGPL